MVEVKKRKVTISSVRISPSGKNGQLIKKGN